MERNTRRSIVISLLVISLMIFNYTRMANSDCVRPIHMVTFMVMGAAAYVLIVNIIGLIKRSS